MQNNQLLRKILISKDAFVDSVLGAISQFLDCTRITFHDSNESLFRIESLSENIGKMISAVFLYIFFHFMFSALIISKLLFTGAHF